MKFFTEKYCAGIAEDLMAQSGDYVCTPQMMDSWAGMLGLDGEKGVPFELVRDHAAGVMTASSMVMHYRCGQPVYLLSQEMHDAFLRTDLTGVTLDDLTLPHDCIYIAVPKGIYKMWGGPSTEWHDCDGIYIRRRTYFEVPKDVGDIIGEDIPKMGTIKDLIPKLERAGMTEEDLRLYQKQGFIMHAACLENEKSTARGDDCHTWCSVSLDDWQQDEKNNDVEGFLRARVFREMKDSTSNSLSYPTDEIADQHAQQYFDLCKVAMNAIVYMNNGLETKTLQRRDNRSLNNFWSMFQSATSPSKRRTYGRKATRLARATVYQLGPQVLFSPRRKSFDVLVRGHWHTYWVGKGRLRRKLNWIQPYIRNKRNDDEQ